MALRLSVRSAAMAVAIVSAVAGTAGAGDVAGWVIKVNRAEESITLNNFQSFSIPAILMPADLMIGSTVKISFDPSVAVPDEKTVTKLVVVCHSFGAPCRAPDIAP